MSKTNVIQASGKRKTAVARATIKKGTGKVTINKIPLEVYTPELAKDRIMEPIILYGKAANTVDIAVNINGGGVTSQANAARVAIGKAIVAFDGNSAIEEMFLEYDRQLLVPDVRRREPSKPGRHGKARAKRQKSYR